MSINVGHCLLPCVHAFIVYLTSMPMDFYSHSLHAPKHLALHRSQGMSALLPSLLPPLNKEVIQWCCFQLAPTYYIDLHVNEALVLSSFNRLT